MKHIDIPLALFIFSLVFLCVVVVVVIRVGVNDLKYREEDQYKDSERPFIDKH
jgi:hypothetical protein